MKTISSQRKATQRAALRARLESAQRGIYGNAWTPSPRVDVPGFVSFYDWLGEYAEREADYMSVDNFGMTENETRSAARLASPYWRRAVDRLADARREHPEPRYASQVRNAARVNFAFPCGEFETTRRVLILDAYDVLTKETTRNGKARRESAAYSYGRNGKTFYPAAYAGERGYGYGARDLSELPYADAVRACQFIEQFNAHVRSVAKDARNVYVDEARDALQETIAEQHGAMKKARAGYRTLADELRKLRGVTAPTACDILRSRLHSLARDVYDAARVIRETRDTLAQLRGAA